MKEDLKKGDEQIEENSVTIGSRGREVYNQVILDKLQAHDQIKLYFLGIHTEKAAYIITQWGAIGVLPENKYINNSGILQFEQIEKEIDYNGKKVKRIVNTIELSKHPTLYRFTRSK